MNLFCVYSKISRGKNCIDFMLQYVSDKMQFNTFLNERKPSQNLSILCLVEALTLSKKCFSYKKSTN